VTRSAELAWALGFVDQTGQGDDDFASAESVSAVFAEWPNLLDALDQAAGTDRAVAGLRLALALHTPWLIRGWYAEAARHFEALSVVDGPTQAERVTALSNHGFVLTMLGRFEEAAAKLSEADEVARELNDDTLTLTVLYYRGIVEIERGALRDAFSPLLAGKELAGKSPAHERRLFAFTDALGTLYLYTGRPDLAKEQYEIGIEADRAYGDEHGLSRGLSNLAGALVAMSELDEALEAAAESDHYARRLDDRQILPLNDIIRASVSLAKGVLGDAEKHLRSAVEYAVADNAGVTMAHIDLADVLILEGELDEASALLDLVFADAPEHSTPWLAARTIAAALAMAQGNREAAADLVTQTTAAATVSGFAWPRYTTRLNALRQQLENPGVTDPV
jgi:ATP/maltotriose-dependent transcriptional regulator MalT